MSQEYSIKYTTEVPELGEVECHVDFNYTFGRPGRHTMPNGDPGYPDDGDELEVTRVTVVDSGQDVTSEVGAQLENDDRFCEAASEEAVAANEPPEPEFEPAYD